ncbi:DUF7548 family protein [Haloarchaeobius amylolyticus]|uniref:DUF7548 family protein n=1 Tax=Haloarchaeobius amylolyticus TaxID=1198296 RepID=UPI00226D9DCD|nr:hypothetical protein [Haloarchaeobius amylolyticus]
MNRFRTPPTVGIAAAIAFLVAVFVPYVTLSETAISGLGTYYGVGVVAPTYLTLFALVAAIVFAAGREGRTEPDLAAGVTLVLGVVMAALTLFWALDAGAVVSSLGTEDWMEYHPWAVFLCSTLIALCSLWYARVLGLLSA